MEPKKEEKKHAWVEHFTPTPKRPPFTYTFRFVHVGWGHRPNHTCQVSSQSVQQFWLPRGSKFTISHRLGEWHLQQCYALTCNTVISDPNLSIHYIILTGLRWQLRGVYMEHPYCKAVFCRRISSPVKSRPNDEGFRE